MKQYKLKKLHLFAPIFCTFYELNSFIFTSCNFIFIGLCRDGDELSSVVNRQAVRQVHSSFLQASVKNVHIKYVSEFCVLGTCRTVQNMQIMLIWDSKLLTVINVPGNTCPRCFLAFSQMHAGIGSISGINASSQLAHNLFLCCCFFHFFISQNRQRL